jgi:hypothetical protein
MSIYKYIHLNILLVEKNRVCNEVFLSSVKNLWKEHSQMLLYISTLSSFLVSFSISIIVQVLNDYARSIFLTMLLFTNLIAVLGLLLPSLTTAWPQAPNTVAGANPSLRTFSTNSSSSPHRLPPDSYANGISLSNLY